MRSMTSAAGVRALALATLWAPALGQTPCLWQPAQDGPIARLEAPSVVLGGRVLVFGGFEKGLKALTRVDAYDPSTDAWSSLADLPTPVTHAGFARDQRDVWVAGGFLGDHPGAVVDDVWVYDALLDSWSAGPDLPQPRGSGGLFRIGRDLHFVGGVDVDRDTDRDDHWVLDLDDPVAWTVAAPLPVARNHFATITLGGRGYVIGGQFRHDSSPQDVALVHAFDPQAGWTKLQDLPFPRSHFEPGTFLLNGGIAIAGGRANTIGLAAVSDLTHYDPVADTWTALAPLPGPLLAPVVQPWGNEIVLSCGGPTASAPVDDTQRRPADGALPAHVRANCGGGAQQLTASWCPDFGATSGAPWANTGAGDIAGTVDDAIYLTERSGTSPDPSSFDYAIQLPNGDYRVKLHFAEIFWGAPGGGAGGVGSRVFDVDLEGVRVLDDYDILADVGSAAAAVHSFDVTVQDGVLDMSFAASVDQPKLSAFEIIRLDGAQSFCTTSPNSVGSGATIGWTGSLSVAANDFHLTAAGAPPNQASVFLQAATQTNIPLGSGVLCIGPGAFRLPPPTLIGAGGQATHTLDLSSPHVPPATILPGATWNFQFVYRDGALATWNLSDGLSATFEP